MKYLLVLATLAFTTNAQAKNELVDVRGQIERVTIGELDPFAFGDVCVITVRTGAKSVGLVTGFEECTDNEEELKVGRGVTVAKEVLKTISDEGELYVLERTINADEYFRVGFEHIENGLADE